MRIPGTRRAGYVREESSGLRAVVIILCLGLAVLRGSVNFKPGGS